jgi:N-acyl-phosphatidylethanolamine-hydrolysing phospholipase D
VRCSAALSGGSPEVSSLYAPYEKGGRFFCPWGMEQRSFLDVLRWQLRRSPARTRRPVAPVPVVPDDGSRLSHAVEVPELTWIGHASFAFHAEDRVVLFDPHFGPRALLPRRCSSPGLPLESVPANALALLSHNHYDHLDAWTLARLPKSIAWRVPLGLGRTVRSFGFTDVRELGWWGEDETGGWRLTFLPAQHWSNRLGQARDSSLWGMWLLDTGRTRVLFGGDSGWFHGFAEIGRRFAPLDAALLPVGAYLPRWFMSPVHMSPEEALRAFRDTGARLLVPCHWGAFDLADDAVDEPPRELARQLGRPAHADLAPRVRVLAVGETLALGA